MATPILGSPELRQDVVFGHWVIFSPKRASRPSDLKLPASNPSADPKNPSCPFCRGRESDCAPEIFRFPPGDSEWKLRVIENLYPALRRDVDASAAAVDAGAVGRWMEGFGFHDVVIETPWHGVQLKDLSPEEIGDVVVAYKKRVEQLAKCDAIKYVQIFKNHGASAGASMTHSHSQIIGLPIIPPLVAVRLDTMKGYFDRTGKCSLCEIKSDDSLIDTSNHFFAIVPFAAQFPFEIWIIPRGHAAHFHHIDEEKVVDFGALLKLMLVKLSVQLNDPPFNFIAHTAPMELPTRGLPYCHWFLQIIPQLDRAAGFEMGSGCYINPVFPEDAAKILRELEAKK